MSTDIVVAIDFGTTYSGYAYSLSTEPRNVIANRSWGTELAVRTPKAPTCVLTDEYDNFVAFGYKAVNILADNANDEKNYHFYDDIKMTLYKEKMISAKAEVEAVDGHRCQTITIVQMILSYLSKHAIKALQRNNPRLRPNSIRWVLTVPAIWNEAAKQFMRRAAFYADMINDMESERLMIALEPECASYWCQTLHDEVPDDQTKKYMVVDCGGGSVDFIIHEQSSQTHIKEVAYGKSSGARQIEDNIYNVLCEIYGEHQIESYKKDNVEDWILFKGKVETLKQSVSSNRRMNIPISRRFGQNFAPFSQAPRGVTYNQNRNTITFEGQALIAALSPLDEMVQQVYELNSDNNDVSLIYLVGGLSSYENILNIIRNGLKGGPPCVVPPEADAAVMKGAVLYGWTPGNIKFRKARNTFVVGQMQQGGMIPTDRFLSRLINKTEWVQQLPQLMIDRNDDIRVQSMPLIAPDRLRNIGEQPPNDIYYMSYLTTQFQIDRGNNENRIFQIEIYFLGSEIRLSNCPYTRPIEFCVPKSHTQKEDFIAKLINKLKRERNIGILREILQNAESALNEIQNEEQREQEIRAENR